MGSNRISKKARRVAFFEERRDLCCLHRLVREPSDNERGENLLGFQTFVEAVLLETLSQFTAEVVGFDEQADQPALDRLCGLR